MTLNDFLSQPDAPTAVAFAAVLKTPASLLSQWRTGVRPVPAERCLEIERASNGAVRCEDLRPDIDWTRADQPAERQAA